MPPPIAKLAEPGFWERDDTRAAMIARIPDYRLSKFQPALPTWAVAEMLGTYLLDFDGTAAFLAETWQPGAGCEQRRSPGT